MDNSKLLMKAVMCLLLVTAIPNIAGADTWTGYASASVSGYDYTDISGHSASGPVTVAMNITPFDTSLGVLNSVTMYAEVNASGSLQAWYYGDLASLSYTLSNKLAVAEMGNTVAGSSGTKSIYGEPDWGAFFLYTVSGNKYTITTLTSAFGRFLAGPDPFQVFLTLSGTASSSDPLMTDVYFDFDGNATLTYEYDYTPAAVPEPATMLLLGLGLACAAAAGKRFRK
jgi:hypothetical protein